MGILRRLADGMRVGLDYELIIGRSELCRLQLRSPRASLQHAKLRYTDSGWILRDLGSSNGTRIDGLPITVAVNHRLQAGSVVEFGSEKERWELTDGEAPCARALALTSAPDICLQNGLLCFPFQGQPHAISYETEAEGWVLEQDEATCSIRSGDVVQVQDQSWRFFAPLQKPEATTRHLKPGLKKDRFSDVCLNLSVSRDFEHIFVAWERSGGNVQLGTRSCFFLLYVLAQHRIAQNPQVLCDHAGWVSVERVNSELGRPGADSHLNVDIFRLRQSFREVGCPNSDSVIERKAGMLRLGTSRVTISELARSATP